MTDKELIQALRCCSSEPNCSKCADECVFYNGFEVTECIPKMGTEVADRLETLLDENEHLREVTKMMSQWVSVSERLPEDTGLYITYGCAAVPVRRIWIENFDKDMGKFGIWWDYEPDGTKHPHYRFIEAENVTHWMPLPEPPSTEGGVE